MFGFNKNALAIVKSCFSPAETAVCSLFKTVLYPSGRVRTKLSTKVALQASRNSSSDTSLSSGKPYFMFSSIVPLYSHLSQLSKRLLELPCVLNKRLYVAYAHCSAYDIECADKRNDNIIQIRKQT